MRRIALVVVLGLAACSNDSSVVSAPSHSTTASAVASPTPAPTAMRPVHPVVKVQPATGLHDKQVVTVTASGFSPDEALQVIECADKGKATGPGDCNLAGILPATSDASGALTVRLTVLRGPFGGNKVVCDARQRCLVSVTQASLSPTEEADAPISFTP